MANVHDAAASVHQWGHGLEDMEAYLEQHRVLPISWHTRLNNHASTRQLSSFVDKHFEFVWAQAPGHADVRLANTCW